MVLAAVRDDTYNLFLFLHIVAVIVTFASVLLNPMLEAFLRKTEGAETIRDWSAFNVWYTRIFSLGGLAVLFVTGVVMILVSDDVIEFSDTWISLSFLVWFAMGGVLSAMVLKGQKLMAAGDMSGRSKAVLGNQITSVLVLVALYLMVFKPGA